MRSARAWIVGSVVFGVIALGADRAIAWAFARAMPWASSRGGCGSSGDGTAYASLAQRADVVVLGHSRARHDYDTGVLRDRLGATVFNAGKNGQGLWYSRGMVDLLTRAYHPRAFVVDIDPQSIVYQPRDHAAIAFLAPQMDQSPVVRELVLGQSTLEPVKYLSRSFRFNSRLVLMMDTAFVPDTSDAGFSPLTRRLDPDRDVDASESWGSKPWLPDAGLEAMLAAMLREARAEGVGVYLVTSPTWRREGGLDPRQPPLIERIAAIAAAEGVPWLRVSAEEYPEFGGPELFADGTHLNEIGAARFTEIVSEWLIAQGVGVSREHAQPARRP